MKIRDVPRQNFHPSLIKKYSVYYARNIFIVCLFQLDFDWNDPEDKFAPEDETWKAEKEAQLRDAVRTKENLHSINLCKS